MWPGHQVVGGAPTFRYNPGVCRGRRRLGWKATAMIITMGHLTLISYTLGFAVEQQLSRGAAANVFVCTLNRQKLLQVGSIVDHQMMCLGC